MHAAAQPVPPSGPRLASRLAHIEPFHVMVLIARAKALEAQGRSVVNMVVGEPDWPTPAPIVAAGQQALAEGDLHYTPSLGRTVLREAIAGWYRTRYGVALDPARVVVTPGSSGALLLTMGALLDEGDEVLMADPGYPCNRHFVATMGGRAAGVPVGPDSAYQLTAELVRTHWTERTVAVLVGSPSNPTGTLLAPEEMARIHAVVRARGARLIVDEIYHGLTYAGREETALSLGEDVFVINSFSKYFGMTGWRLGWMVVPPDCVPAVEKLAQNLFISASDVAQRAALAAFAPQTLVLLEERREACRRQRDYLLGALRGLGFGIPVEPQGAFYIYADASAFTRDTYTFCRELLEAEGVAVAPGIDFGSHRASSHVRFSYPKPVEVLAEGVARIGRFLQRGARA